MQQLNWRSRTPAWSAPRPRVITFSGGHGARLAGLDKLAARPKPPGVSYHSIIGVASLADSVLERIASGTSWDQESDGAVSYASAHLEGVDSEIVIPANHTDVKQHSLTVGELRRILLEHR